MTRLTSVKFCVVAPKLARVRMLFGAVTSIMPCDDILYGSVSEVVLADCVKIGSVTPLSWTPTLTVSGAVSGVATGVPLKE